MFSNPSARKFNSDAKLFVGKIGQMTKEDLHSLFSPFGTVRDVFVLQDFTRNQPKGCAFVTYEDRKDAIQAITELNGKFVNEASNVLQVKWADGVPGSDQIKLFVGNLSTTTTDEELMKMFTLYGQVTEATVLKNPDGTSKGSGFVRFASQDSGLLAIKSLHGQMRMEGASRELTVREADKTPRREAHHRGAGGSAVAKPVAAAPASQLFAPMGAFGQQNINDVFQAAYQAAFQVNHNHAQAMEVAQTTVQTMTGIGLPAAVNMGMNQMNPMPVGNMGSINPMPNMGGMANAAPMFNAAPLAPNPPPQQQPMPAMQGGEMPMNQMGNEMGMAVPMANLNLSAVNSQRQGPPGANLFIYHLPNYFSETNLLQLFSPFGSICSVKVAVDPQMGTSKGYGFVSFDDAAAAQAAIQGLHGMKIGEKRLRVQVKTASAQGGPRPY